MRAPPRPAWAFRRRARPIGTAGTRLTVDAARINRSACYDQSPGRGPQEAELRPGGRGRLLEVGLRVTAHKRPSGRGWRFGPRGQEPDGQETDRSGMRSAGACALDWTLVLLAVDPFRTPTASRPLLSADYCSLAHSLARRNTRFQNFSGFREAGWRLSEIDLHRGTPALRRLVAAGSAAWRGRRWARWHTAWLLARGGVPARHPEAGGRGKDIALGPWRRPKY